MPKELSRADFLRALAGAVAGCAPSSAVDDAGSRRGLGGEPPAPATSSIPTTSEARAAWRRDAPVALILRGGEVTTGRGDAPQGADVVVDGGKVLFVGRVDATQAAARTLEVRGLTVAPGFIDLHSHADIGRPVDALLAQGVTSVVLGQDGSSPDEGVGPLLTRVRAGGAPVNVGTLVGHASLRREALRRAPDDAARRTDLLAELVAAALSDGALGLSLGLEYDGARGTDHGELVAAMRPLATAGHVAMAHLRSEDDDAVDASIDELVRAASEAGARPHVAHLKIVLGRGEERADRLLGRLEEIRARDVALTADLYPYDASYTTLAILFPPAARPPNRWDVAKKRRRDEILAHLRARVLARNGPEATTFGPGPHRGRTLAEVAAERKRPFEEVLFALGPAGGQAAYRVMDEAVVKRLARAGFVAFGSDGSAESAHPRGHGTFARALGPWVRDERLYSLAEGVRKASSLAASVLGLTDRGALEPGMAADIVVFDASRLSDRATFEEPHALATGVEHVLVNGALVWERGARTSTSPGRALAR